MSVSLPNGAIISIASTYGTAKTMSALSNATSAVGTLEASHGVIVSDIVEITSGWSKVSKRIARASAVSTNDVTMEGIDTSSTTRFPAGTGTGSVREISAWTQISQVLSSQSQGGEQQFTNYQFLEDDTEQQIPTNKSARSLTLSVADDPTLAHYAVLVAADEARTPRAIRIQLPSGGVIYMNGYVTFNKTPTMTINEVMACEVTISLVSEPTRYTS